MQSYYRQWQEMGPRNHIPNTATPACQKIRFLQIAEKWRTAISENPTYSFSDTNINTNSINIQPEGM